MALELGHGPALLQLVDLDHGAEQLEVVTAVAGQLLERSHVLGEAGASEAEARPQEAGADPGVEPHPARHQVDVRTDLLADVRDLVDERDLGRQEGVGGELDHLRGGHVRDQLGAAEPAVERRDALTDGRIVGTHDHPVGMQEVLDRAALAEELGIRGIGDAVQAALVERAAQPRTGPGRHRRLHDHHGIRRPRPGRRRGPTPRDSDRRRQRHWAACRRRRTRCRLARTTRPATT